MVLPKPVYESIPYAYLVAGVLTFLLIESAGRYLPAIFFIAAALLVFQLRHTYRQNQAEQNEAKMRRMRKLARRLNTD